MDGGAGESNDVCWLSERENPSEHGQKKDGGWDEREGVRPLTSCLCRVTLLLTEGGAGR